MDEELYNLPIQWLTYMWLSTAQPPVQMLDTHYSYLLQKYCIKCIQLQTTSSCLDCLQLAMVGIITL